MSAQRRIVRLLDRRPGETATPAEPLKQVNRTWAAKAAARESKWLPVLTSLPISPPTYIAGISANAVGIYGKRHGMRFHVKAIDGGVLVWRIPLSDAPPHDSGEN